MNELSSRSGELNKPAEHETEFYLSKGRLTLICRGFKNSGCGVFYDEDIPKGQKRAETNNTIWSEAEKHRVSQHTAV